MAVTTRLQWMKEKNLQNFLGGKQFSLLYKSSVHGLSAENLIQRYHDQGSFLIVIYSSDFVLVAYIQQQSDQDTRKVSNILFAFKGIVTSTCKIGPSNLSDHFYEFNNCNVKFLIHLSEKKVTMNLDTIKKLKLSPDLEVHKSDFFLEVKKQTKSFQECEVFRCEDLLDTRKMKGVNEIRESLLSAIRTYKPYRELVHQIRILLLGPTGAGKSSFFNSVKSVFQGYVTHHALVGSDSTGISNQYRAYSIKDGKDGKSLPFILCDSMGLSKENGLCMDDILYMLKGHIPDRYQFNSMKPITSGNSNYIDFPSLKDRIHCVAFVFDANSIDHLSDEMIAKIKRARREMIKCGMVYVVLLTCVDNINLVIREDLIDIYRCMPVKLKLNAVHTTLGFALSDILVVSNYTSEWDLDPLKDVLNLSALRQMLWAADEFLEDLPLEETSKCI